MRDLILTEIRKLRRAKVVWLAIFSTFLVAAVVFAQGQFVYYGERYIDKAVWYMESALSLATFFVLPGIISLLGSYMICREEQENTIKTLRMIPINESRLIVSKLIVAWIMSLFIYLLLFSITFIVEALLHFKALQLSDVILMMKVYLLTGSGVFIVSSPIIVFAAKIKHGYWISLVFAEVYSFAGLFANLSAAIQTFYPITAVLQVSGYYEVTISARIYSLAVILSCGLLTLILLKNTNYHTET